MAKYYPPTFQHKAFTCPICDVYAAQSWNALYYANNSASVFRVSTCGHCKHNSYWHDEALLIPSEAPVPVHHPDLPASCIADYDEAREIVAKSPRAAAALLRLVIQKLMVELGQPGRNINEDIGALVKAGLPVEVQQAMDYCRVIGNNAVHPLEIDINGNPEVAHALFEMINFIVQDRITRPREIGALFGNLPEGARQAIEKRDAKAATGTEGA